MYEKLDEYKQEISSVDNHEQLMEITRRYLIEANTSPDKGKLKAEITEECLEKQHFDEKYSYEGKGRPALVHLDLSGASLPNNYLNDILIMNVNFTDANMTGIKLKDSDIIDCTFTNSKLIDGNLQKATITKTTMSTITATSANFGGTKFFGSKILNSKLMGAKFPNAQFDETTIKDNDLSNATWKESTAENSFITDNNLSRNDLSDFKCIETTFTNNDLTFAYLTNSTGFPQTEPKTETPMAIETVQTPELFTGIPSITITVPEEKEAHPTQTERRQLTRQTVIRERDHKNPAQINTTQKQERDIKEPVSAGATQRHLLVRRDNVRAPGNAQKILEQKTALAAKREAEPKEENKGQKTKRPDYLEETIKKEAPAEKRKKGDGQGQSR